MSNTKFKFILIGFMFLLSGCNDNKKKDEQVKEEKFTKHIYRIIDEDNNEARYTVELIAQIDKADNFQLFYTEDFLLSFTEDRVLTKFVPGLPEAQSIVFELPVNVAPDRYRLDVGSVKKQGKLKIESLSIKNNKKEILIKSDSIKYYLEPNQFIKNNGSYYVLNTINQDGVELYDPYFTCSPLLVRALSKIY